MKRFLFLTLLSCVCLWTHTVAGREHKNERDEEEERSISPNPVEVKIVNDGIMFYFMKPLDNVFIQIVDDSGMLVYEESVLFLLLRAIVFPCKVFYLNLI